MHSWSLKFTYVTIATIVIRSLADSIHVPSSTKRPQWVLPFLHDKLRLCTLARLTGARDTRRAARLSSSGITANRTNQKQVHYMRAWLNKGGGNTRQSFTHDWQENWTQKGETGLVKTHRKFTWWWQALFR